MFAKGYIRNLMCGVGDSIQVYMSCGVRVTFIHSLHSLTIPPHRTHIWITTRVIDPYQFRTTYIYRTHKIGDAGCQKRECNHHGSRYGNICSNSYPEYISVARLRSLIIRVPSVPVPVILATSAQVDISMVQTSAITLSVIMLVVVLQSGQDSNLYNQPVTPQVIMPLVIVGLTCSVYHSAT